jgi:hypothetical protein
MFPKKTKKRPPVETDRRFWIASGKRGGKAFPMRYLSRKIDANGFAGDKFDVAASDPEIR